MSWRPASIRGSGKERVMRRLLARFSRRTGRSPLQAAVHGLQRKNRQKAALTRGGLLALLGLLLFAGWAGVSLLHQADIFRLLSVSVVGNRVVADSEVLSWANVEQGMSLLDIDTTAMEKIVASHPWIARAKVVRRWPSGLEISVDEQRPVALVNVVTGDTSQLMYASGDRVLFALVEQGQDLDFPVLTGSLEEAGLAGDHFLEDSLAAQAFELLRQAARGGDYFLPSQAISEIYLDPKEGLILYLVDKSFPIYFGVGRIHTKYQRLIRVLEDLYRSRQIDDTREIRMDYTRNKVLVARAD